MQLMTVSGDDATCAQLSSILAELHTEAGGTASSTPFTAATPISSFTSGVLGPSVCASAPGARLFEPL